MKKRFSYLNGGLEKPKPKPIASSTTAVSDSNNVKLIKSQPAPKREPFDNMQLEVDIIRDRFKRRQAGKATYDTGGLDEVKKINTDPLTSTSYMSQYDPILARKFNLVPQTSSTPGKPSNSTNNQFSSVAPFLDNFGNLLATAKTPQIPQPLLNQSPRLTTKINTNPQIRQILDDSKSINKGIDMSTSSAGVANANKGKVMADKWRALGNLSADKYNTEANLQNQQAYADAQTKAGNNQLLNQRNYNQMLRQDDVNSRYASVIGDFGSDIANINREKNLMARDKEALKMLMKVNPDAVYQFADTDTFKDLYQNDEPGLRKLILQQKGTATKTSLTKLYKALYNKDFQ